MPDWADCVRAAEFVCGAVNVLRLIVYSQGFFRSLFTGGFAETDSNARIAEGRIDITFNDPNITRPGASLVDAKCTIY